MSVNNNVIDQALPLSVAEGGTGAATFTSNAVLVGNGASAVTTTASAMNDGYILVGSTGGLPVATTITAGAGIGVTNGSNSITLTGPTGYVWTAETTNTTMAANNGYFAAGASALVTFTLPASAAVGDEFFVINEYGITSSWKIAQNAGQQIVYGNVSTTSGTGGSLASTAYGDAVHLVCTTANTTFTVVGSIGNITIV